MRFLGLACSSLCVALAAACGGTPTSDHLHDCDGQPEEPAIRVTLAPTGGSDTTVLLQAGMLALPPKGAGPLIIEGSPGGLTTPQPDRDGYIMGADRLGTVTLRAGNASAVVHVVCHR